MLAMCNHTRGWKQQCHNYVGLGSKQCMEGVEERMDGGGEEIAGEWMTSEGGVTCERRWEPQWWACHMVVRADLKTNKSLI